MWHLLLHAAPETKVKQNKLQVTLCESLIPPPTMVAFLQESHQAKTYFALELQSSATINPQNK